MKVSWRSEIALLAIILAMFVLAIAGWASAPERIPIHWNIQGQVDRYAGKAVGLLMPPAVALALYLLFLIVPRIDPFKASYPSFTGAYNAVRLSVISLLAVLSGVTHLWVHGRPIVMSTVFPLLFGGLFIILGNYLGKLRPNWFIGIRTPWTLTSRTAWAKTHRLGGWLFIATGLISILADVLFNRWAYYFLLASVTASAIVSFLYSYLVWRKAPDRKARDA
jgi:uncharacterized membrane protein